MEKMENGEDKDRIEGRNAEEEQEGDCCYKKKERKENQSHVCAYIQHLHHRHALSHCCSKHGPDKRGPTTY